MKPGFYSKYNVNPDLVAENHLDDDGNPTGGRVDSIGLTIAWQDGPRGSSQEGAGLNPPNGAFVEDVIYAAIQRLQFFNESKYRDRSNSLAITKLEEALQALNHRRFERAERNVEGHHLV